jgi:hypothetical protein
MGRPPGGRGVIGAQFLAVAGVAEVLVPVELRGVLDLFLVRSTKIFFVLRVDPDHGGRREENLLAEDPDPGVHDRVGVTDLVGVLVDLADVAVDSLDLVAGQIAADQRARGRFVTPHILRRAKTILRSKRTARETLPPFLFRMPLGGASLFFRTKSDYPERDASFIQRNRRGRDGRRSAEASRNDGMAVTPSGQEDGRRHASNSPKRSRYQRYQRPLPPLGS